MKRLTTTLVLTVTLFFTNGMWAGAAPEKDAGLLVVIHGSPSPKWNEPIQALEEGIRKAIESESSVFKAAKIANLEFKKPMVDDGVNYLIEQGCERIVCMPLFIAHSSHVIYDIPAALGTFSSPSIHETLKEEGASIAPAKVPIVMGPTLCESDLLLHSTLERVKELSKDPANEAIVILAHGDHGIQGTWNELARRTACYVCGKTGISYADWAFVEVGQSYTNEGLFTISRAANYKKRVLVVGLYISLSPKRIHDRTVERNPRLKNMFKDTEVVFTERGFLPDERVTEWLVKTAMDVDRNRFGNGSSE